MMKTYYYIAKRKQRGYSESYVGDGVMEANSMAEVREHISHSYRVSKKRVYVTLRKDLGKK